MDSWLDYFLLGELSGNVDAYKKSMYYHKDRDSLLKLGPIWDFDWALKFLGENGFPNGAGWLYTIDPCTQDVLYVPYFKRLMEDSFFQNKVCERWESLRNGILDTTQIFNYIDSTAMVLDEAKTRHFQRWQCLGYDSGAPEAPPYPTTYAGEVQKLKRFLRQRIAWMDAKLPLVACDVPTVEPDEAFEIIVLPNVGKGDFLVRAKGIKTASGKLPASIFDARGVLLRKLFLANGDQPLDLNDLPSGAYFIQIETKPALIMRRLMVVR
jgi:CotH kinase protein